MNLEGVPPQTLEHLLALTQRLTTRRDLDGLLHDLLDGSLQLIPGADFVCIFLYQSEHNALIPVGGVGFDMAQLQSVWIKPGESMTGKAYLQREPLLLPNPQSIREAQQNLSPEHDALVRRAVGRPDNAVRSSMALPLVAGPRTIGVMVIDNYDTDRDFDHRDLAVAASLADHAALAVINAEDYQDARTLSHELQRTLQLQKRLVASMMSPNASMQTLLKTLWTMLDRPLAVYDDNHDMVAHYGDQLHSAHRIPIQVGDHWLGELVIGKAHNVESDHIALEQAIPLIALEFMKRDALEQERLTSASHAFQHIWDGDTERLNQVVRKYQLDRTSWQFVLVSRSDPSAVKDIARFSRTHDIPMMSRDGHDLLLLRGEHGNQLHEPLIRITSTAFFWGEESHLSSQLTAQLRALVLLFEGCSVYFSHSEARNRHIALQDYPEIKLVDALPQEVKRTFAAQILDALKKDPVLFESVVVYVTSNRSINATSTILHTHPNTVRYRIDKASQILGRSLSDDRTVSALRWALLATIDLRL